MKKTLLAVAVLVAQVALGGLREDFVLPRGAARENTGPLFWMRRDNGIDFMEKLKALELFWVFLMRRMRC